MMFSASIYGKLGFLMRVAVRGLRSIAFGTHSVYTG